LWVFTRTLVQVPNTAHQNEARVGFLM